VQQTHQESNPDLRGWSSACSRYTTSLRERTTRLERASPGWRPGALPAELRPHGYARLGSNQRPLPSQDSAHSAELRAFDVKRQSLRQESNPHLGRTKGACLPLTLRRHESGDGGSRTRSSSVQTRCSSRRTSSPWTWPLMEPLRLSSPLVSGTSEASAAECVVSRRVRTGGVEPPQPEAARLQRAELTSAQHPQE
jgi:hypothetical protein